MGKLGWAASCYRLGSFLSYGVSLLFLNDWAWDLLPPCHLHTYWPSHHVHASCNEISGTTGKVPWSQSRQKFVVASLCFVSNIFISCETKLFLGVITQLSSARLSTVYRTGERLVVYKCKNMATNLHPLIFCDETWQLLPSIGGICFLGWAHNLLWLIEWSGINKVPVLSLETRKLCEFSLSLLEPCLTAMRTSLGWETHGPFAPQLVLSQHPKPEPPTGY